MILLIAIMGILGLVVGSFINVVIHRVPRGQSIVHPSSRCPQCGTPISPRDNVPVISYLLLRGRCQSCKVRIPLRYPMVEALTGVLFAGAAYRFGFDYVLLPALVFLGVLVTLAGDRPLSPAFAQLYSRAGGARWDHALRGGRPRPVVGVRRFGSGGWWGRSSS